jgi:hypothetical protein
VCFSNKRVSWITHPSLQRVLFVNFLIRILNNRVCMRVRKWSWQYSYLETKLFIYRERNWQVHRKSRIVAHGHCLTWYTTENSVANSNVPLLASYRTKCFIYNPENPPIYPKSFIHGNSTPERYYLAIVLIKTETCLKLLSDFPNFCIIDRISTISKVVPLLIRCFTC